MKRHQKEKLMFENVGLRNLISKFGPEPRITSEGEDDANRDQSGSSHTAY
jgi:hypothetical protein